MNTINQKGLKIIQTSEYIEVNGVKTLIPDHVKSKSNSMSVINGTISINGYTFDPINKTFTKNKLFFSILKHLFR